MAIAASLAASISVETQLSWHRAMLLIRTFEEAILGLNRAGLGGRNGPSLHRYGSHCRGSLFGDGGRRLVDQHSSRARARA